MPLLFTASYEHEITPDDCQDGAIMAELTKWRIGYDIVNKSDKVHVVVSVGIHGHPCKN